MIKFGDPDLPKDQAGAIAFLAKLAEKDHLVGEKCFYPTCDATPRAYDGKGQPPKYCHKHNARISYDARKYLRDLAKGVSAEEAGRMPPVAPHKTIGTQDADLHSTLLRVEHLLTERRTHEQEWSDPTYLDAQIETSQAQADTRVAEAQEKERAEHERRLAAERAKEAALRAAESAQDAADLAISQQEELEAKNQMLREELVRQLAEKQDACDREIAAFRAEMEQEIETIQAQMNARLSEAQIAIRQAREETARAKEQAREVEEQARIQTASAERLVLSIKEERDREHQEVLRLRGENDKLSKRIEEERQEARTTLGTAQAEFRDQLAQERSERHAIQDELKRERQARQLAEKRSDDQAAQADKLRETLAAWLQTGQQPPKDQKKS